MKIKSTIIALVLLVTGLATSPAQATENPTVESFTFTPTEIDLLSASTKLDFELIVTHPFGIENLSSFVTIKDLLGSTWGTPITRTDNPVNTSLKRVTFKGSVTLPRTISPGVYTVSASEVKNNKAAGYVYSSGEIFSKKLRELIDAENALLIRSNGDLNYIYSTFQGPTYDSSLSIIYKDPNKYSSSNKPIWRVGEIFNPLDFYEKKINSLELLVKSYTSSICSSDGKTLKFITEGSCEFSVYTSKTKDFAAFEDKQVAQILSPRMKSTLIVPKIDNQTSKDLPKTISIPQVYSAAAGFVLAKTNTPFVCLPSGFTLRLLSGGICTLTYETAATSTYLASDVYQQTFEIVRDPQTITFTLPSTANVSTKSITLAATASSGAAITYSTASAEICSITGSTLNLLRNGNCAVTATQAGTSTLAPVSATATVALTSAAVSNRKTITCVKGKSTKKVSGVNPKCPKGFKIKR
jgi:hypothetical protein